MPDFFCSLFTSLFLLRVPAGRVNAPVAGLASVPEKFFGSFLCLHPDERGRDKGARAAYVRAGGGKTKFDGEGMEKYR